MIERRLAMVIEKFDEIKRFYPDMKEDFGIFNLDINCFFPYSNQEVLTLGAGLFNSTLLNLELAIIYDDDITRLRDLMFKDVILNHRYPNHQWVSLSKKSGNRRCKTGYPICGPIEELNRYDLLAVNLGIEDENFFCFFPLELKLSSDKPVGCLKLRIHHFEKSYDEEAFKNFGFDFFTMKIVSSEIGKSERAGKEILYYWGKPMFRKLSEGTRLEIEELSEDDRIFSFNPKITIPGQPRDYFFL